LQGPYHQWITEQGAQHQEDRQQAHCRLLPKQFPPNLAPERAHGGFQKLFQSTFKKEVPRA
jgi:hypothetical protein